MAHGDALAEGLWKRIGLKPRRADARVPLLEMQHVVEVFQADAQRLGLGGRAREFRVEIEMRIAREVIQLAIKPQPRLGPDIAQEERLAPAGMGEDHVGRIAAVAQVRRRAPARLAARHLGVEIHQPRVQRLARAFRQGIGDHPHALPCPRLLDPQRERHAMMAHPRQPGGEVLVLPRKILVDEKDVHGPACPAALGRL